MASSPGAEVMSKKTAPLRASRPLRRRIASQSSSYLPSCRHKDASRRRESNPVRSAWVCCQQPCCSVSRQHLHRCTAVPFVNHRRASATERRVSEECWSVGAVDEVVPAVVTTGAVTVGDDGALPFPSPRAYAGCRAGCSSAGPRDRRSGRSSPAACTRRCRHLSTP